MSDIFGEINALCFRLQAAIDSNDEDCIARFWKALENTLSSKFSEIYDERVLSNAVRVLRNYYDHEPSSLLDELVEHLALVHEINDKLWAILDYNVSLEELLYSRLAKWPMVEGKIECSFDDSTEKHLDNLRKSQRNADGLEEFLLTYIRYIRSQDLIDHAETIESYALEAVAAYRRLHNYQIQGLLAANSYGLVLGLKLTCEPRTDTPIQAFDDVGPQMRRAANHAIACAEHIAPQLCEWSFRYEVERDDLKYDGASIGFGLTIGILAYHDGIQIDSFTAFTGAVEGASLDGDLSAVSHIEAKLSAAAESGIRRVFIPRANIPLSAAPETVEIIDVSTVREAYETIKNQDFSRAITSIDSKIRHTELLLLQHHVYKVGDPLERPEQRMKQIKFTDRVQDITVNFYDGKKGPNYSIGGKDDTQLKATVESVLQQIFGAKITSQGSHKNSSYMVHDHQLRQQIDIQFNAFPGSQRQEAEHCYFRYHITQGGLSVYVHQYSSGTLTLQGVEPLFNQVDALVRKLINVTDKTPSQVDRRQSRKNAQIEAVRSVNLGKEWIGTDESGKGDYFGPLVSAAVFVNPELVERLDQLGVKDSKRVSDKQIRELAPKIMTICGDYCSYVVVRPVTYNKRYQEFQQEGKNLNTFLAWTHTRALENILQKLNPEDRIYVLIDKFADPEYILNKLLPVSRTTELNIVQLPKAEANIAVAAASIVARFHFLRVLQQLSAQYGVQLPKGSSDPNIVTIARQIVDAYGKDELASVAKLHFKTTKKVLE